jgi:hypothetical protein
LDTILYNGPITNRINYVILGDGYLASQLDAFQDDAKALSTALFTTPPYSQYINYFNVFSISVPSNKAGAANNPELLIDNYFGSTFNFAGIERLLVPTNNDRVADVLANTFPAYDQVFMLVNSPLYGGSGGWVATASTHEQSNDIALHELGHSFADLADEYWAGEPYARETYNMTQESSSKKVRWKHWLGKENIRIIPHGGTTWKKPHEYCKMQFLESSFCAVCREQFINVAQLLVSVIDDYSPRTLDAFDDDIHFNISLVTPTPNTLRIAWLLNDEIIAANDDSIDINKASLVKENNKLRVNVCDSTTLNRRSTVYVSWVIWNITNKVTSSITKGVDEREVSGEEIITAVEVVDEERLMLSVFPNPTADILKVQYVLQRPSNVQLSVIDGKGQLITSSSNWRNAGENHDKIDLRRCEQGTYFLRFKSSSFNQTIKIIKRI